GRMTPGFTGSPFPGEVGFVGAPPAFEGLELAGPTGGWIFTELGGTGSALGVAFWPSASEHVTASTLAATRARRAALDAPAVPAAFISPKTIWCTGREFSLFFTLILQNDRSGPKKPS
ncbi:MAG: hypothetical protein NTV94_09405, partial [Planctomycetota bacterium]|nr:hypothetical protein [Planctomycetota bacterium]